MLLKFLHKIERKDHWQTYFTKPGFPHSKLDERYRKKENYGKTPHMNKDADILNKILAELSSTTHLKDHKSQFSWFYSRYTRLF